MNDVIFTDAHTLKIESDERGWELHIDTDNGNFVFNIHSLAWDFADEVKVIQGWRMEGEAARYGARPITPEDLEAYELGDPKRISLEREMEG
jgi:hypothetical protein